MKLLIAYDGSSSADQALDDLQKAGLPEQDVEAQIVSVAEVWMPPQPNGNGLNPESALFTDLAEKHRTVAAASLHEAEAFARHARDRVLAKFPAWRVAADAKHGSPAREILACAKIFRPDLIVVGSQGRNGLSRILLGSISKKVLTEANCSVRVARGKIEVDPFPLRILIAFDGSAGAEVAVREVARRRWGNETEVCLLAAVHALAPTTIGRFMPPVRVWIKEEFESEKSWVRKLTKGPVQTLEKAGLKVSVEILEGNPKDVIAEWAASWQADAIFMGAHSYANLLEKFLVGSTTGAVAERAGCSVEAVRENVGGSEL